MIQEATAVVPEGRITPSDAGLWSEAHTDAYKPIVKFIKSHGAIPGIQLAHAGRKASVMPPWEGNRGLDTQNGGWETVAPSALAFDKDYPMPRALEVHDIENLVAAFAKAAERSRAAGFEVVEIHAAHGYLLHEFLSPLSNTRTDHYGGSLENRMRLTLEISAAVRRQWPQDLPVFVRISASDWVEGGWDLEQSITLSAKLKKLGIDLIDASSGGNISSAKIAVGPGYQVPFADAIKKKALILTGAVGMITEARQAEHIIASGQADVVLLARELLRDPYWPLHAAGILGADVAWPQQYERAKPHVPR